MHAADPRMRKEEAGNTPPARGVGPEEALEAGREDSNKQPGPHNSGRSHDMRLQMRRNRILLWLSESIASWSYLLFSWFRVNRLCMLTRFIGVLSCIYLTYNQVWCQLDFLLKNKVIKRNGAGAVRQSCRQLDTYVEPDLKGMPVCIIYVERWCTWRAMLSHGLISRGVRPVALTKWIRFPCYRMNRANPESNISKRRQHFLGAQQKVMQHSCAVVRRIFGG